MADKTVNAAPGSKAKDKTGARSGDNAKKGGEFNLPEYREAKVRCACGNEFETRSTKEEISVEICSKCHPFFTGKQKFVDTGGRVEKFNKRYGKSGI